MSNTDKAIIIALDFPGEQGCLDFLQHVDPVSCRVKVGKELFTRCGPLLVKNIINMGFEVFLDLKFHDIPNTVANAVAAAADLGVWMVNVHACGGRKMMEAARNAVDYNGAPLLIAVTVLTSMSDEDLFETGVSSNALEQVSRLGLLSRDSGLDGVVCSSLETAMLRNQLGEDFVLVTPGIRPSGDAAGDQQRIQTPAAALREGSNYLVIGRPITRAEDPQAKLQAIIAEITK